MSSSAKNAFPHFVDGDVLVIVSTTQYYKLHSQVLSTHSTFFAEHFAKRPGPRLNAQARRENLPAYRFEFNRGMNDAFGDFVRVDLNESGRIVDASVSILANEFDNGKVPDNTNRAWEWLFGVFYNREPVFDVTSLATVLSCVVALIECAESIGAIDHVRDVVDLALMRQDTVLWTSILGNPQVWIELGRRVRSPSIYSEAAIHLIGQWSNVEAEEKERISPDIFKILNRKADKLALMKEAIELRILGHYPEFMRRSAQDKPGRPTYGNDIYMWMAVCFFRQWFAQSISDDRTRRAPDGGLSFYLALHQGGEAYLSHPDFQEFHKYFPMSLKACQLLEANMNVLKGDIKSFVDDLMIETTHIKRNAHSIGWLTCITIEKEDMPWNNPDEPKQSADNLQLSGTLDDDTMMDDNAMAKAFAEANTARQKNKAGSESGGSGRPKKRTRFVDADSASGSEYYPESNATNDMFVNEGGNDMVD